MAKNYSIDYGAKDGPALIDDDTGYEVGEAPQEKTIRQLKNLKNFGNFNCCIFKIGSLIFFFILYSNYFFYIWYIVT